VWWFGGFWVGGGGIGGGVGFEMMVRFVRFRRCGGWGFFVDGDVLFLS
jgi:hypothetical protein